MSDSTKLRNPALGLPLHEFPYPWASDWGEDEYGIWVAFTLRGVRYAFRWITPGTFIMGSPEGEPERAEDEVQHPVTLTQGFWIGETPVTQALWQTAMGEILSKFKGDDRPIERVSMDDCQQFIEKARAIDATLDLRLPTEAEWEYACRAGTTTAFHFGNQISTDQVNYDGNYPYKDGEKGEYREETVPVYALPCNAWGLWQMHGNVREWCSDRYVPNMPQAKDPVGPDNGVSRLVRGGSWSDESRLCRSANRLNWYPSGRLGSLGFRLAAEHLQESGVMKPDAST